MSLIVHNREIKINAFYIRHMVITPNETNINNNKWLMEL